MLDTSAHRNIGLLLGCHAIFLWWATDLYNDCQGLLKWAAIIIYNKMAIARKEISDEIWTCHSVAYNVAMKCDEHDKRSVD